MASSPLLQTPPAVVFDNWRVASTQTSVVPPGDIEVTSGNGFTTYSNTLEVALQATPFSVEVATRL
ncbi:hypothetical protein NC99_14410 [Sunxiuqinia dokdonensis]|uniref:Uncharacterized protein n=1 Tax=Sunxiuqinia dokdonensis TaxID=1409788 RepID=A0A0L8VBB6_9BACT|nr:hypothetical protein NC99_14410 [Sunxiuqinia dokdonensis]